MITIQTFKKTIWQYYRKNKRDLPWRKTRDPYKILVSEIMLQQTQAHRVIPKYNSFLKKFPNTKTLAKAKLSDVLKEWQGLGYNRRAIYLKRCAEVIEEDFKGKFVKDFDVLCSLPGIGPATAGDIFIFAWNLPRVVIETNVRSVFIHFFFKDKTDITDKEILPFVEKTLDMKNPREWYSALFDYGVHLKKTLNPSRRSAHHVTQTKFIGSYRQKRAHILRIILKEPQMKKHIRKTTGYEPKIVTQILDDLEKEGFIKRTKNFSYHIK